MLDEDKEDNTGVSRLSQGLNKDAISKQNLPQWLRTCHHVSAETEDYRSVFANNYVKPLFNEIYRLCVENETEQKIFEVAGDYVAVDPASWSEQRDVVVELKLGYGEQDREAQKMMQLHQMFSQDPTLQPMFVQNRYQLMKKMLEAKGILNVEDYLTPP